MRSRSIAAACLLSFAGSAGVGHADDTFSRLQNKPTFLSHTRTGTVAQPPGGHWWWVDRSGGGRRLYRYSFLDNRQWLVLHRGSNPRVDSTIRAETKHLISEAGGDGIIGQFKGEGRCFAGLVRTYEVTVPGRKPECPQFYWWTRAQMCFDEAYRTATGKTAGFMHDAGTCESDPSRPTSQPFTLERFLGAAFAPVWQQAYIRTMTVVAPAQFAIEVKVAWDYRIFHAEGSQPARVTFAQANGSEIFETAALSGARAIPVNAPTRTQYVFTVHDRQGRELHRDYLVADLRR